MKKMIKKIIRKIIGWYVEPVYQQNIDLQEQLEKYQSELSEYKQCHIVQKQQTVEQALGLINVNERLDAQNTQLLNMQQCVSETQQCMTDLQKNIVGWNELVEKMQEQSEIDIKQAITINDYINSKQTAIIYAYRFLLNREPENLQLITENVRDWKKLREDVMISEEYKMLNEVPDNMPFNSVCVEGITYFFNKGDVAIPFAMMTSNKNWASEDIKNFLNIADKYTYNEDVQDGIFLDIGGNVGTTSIYCKLKIKKQLKYIAFEPISILAKLFKTNVGFNDASDIFIENIGLSDQTKMNVPMVINHENWGNNQIDFDRQKDADEFISITTLDSYIAEHDINAGDIKYIWLDVEGHETEVLEGAANLYKTKRIPTCIEFNQGIYAEQQKYEKMLVLLKKYFKQFVVCSAVGTDRDGLRPINELDLLWDEFDQKSCDLILL